MATKPSSDHDAHQYSPPSYTKTPSASSTNDDPSSTARPDPITTIADAQLTLNEALTIHTYCTQILGSLQTALEFLHGFELAGWPTPARVCPSCSQHCSRTSQLDQDLIVARHLAICATMRKLVSLGCYPKKGELFARLKMMQGELQAVSEWFCKCHGGAGGERGEDVRRLRELKGWYVESFEPVLKGVVDVLRAALGDERGWRLTSRNAVQRLVDGEGREACVCEEKKPVALDDVLLPRNSQTAEKKTDIVSGRSLTVNAADGGFHPRSFRERMDRLHRQRANVSKAGVKKKVRFADDA